MLSHTVPSENAYVWTGEPLSSYPSGTESGWAGWAASTTPAAPAATAAAAAPTHQLAGSPSVIEKFNPLVTTDPAEPASAFSSPGDACCDPWCTAYCREPYAAVAEPPPHHAAALAAADAAAGGPAPHPSVVVNEVVMDCPGSAQVGNVVITCKVRPPPPPPAIPPLPAHSPASTSSGEAGYRRGETRRGARAPPRP